MFAGSHIPPQFQSRKKCKWSNCGETFEDAVDAFKHIKDAHLQQKQSSALEKRKPDDQLSSESKIKKFR